MISLNERYIEQELDDSARQLEYEYTQSKEDIRELNEIIKMYISLNDKNWEPLIDNFFYVTLKLAENLFDLTKAFESNLINFKKNNSHQKIKTLEELLLIFKNNINEIIKSYSSLAKRYISRADRTPKNIYNSTIFCAPEKIQNIKQSNIKINNNKGCFPYYKLNSKKIKKPEKCHNINLEESANHNNNFI